VNSRKIVEALILIDQQAQTYELGKESGWTFGRDPTNTLVLNDIKVSRQHSVIRWEGENFVVRDMGSRNGTYVNNELIQVSKLVDGDILRIGNNEFMVRLATQQLVEQELFRQRRQMACLETHMEQEDEFRINESGFSGNLRTLSMMEIIQTIMQFGKDGRLLIHDENEEVIATAFFREGEIIHAEFDQDEGKMAIYKMMRLETGVFEFKNDTSTIERTINQSTMSLLMEACKFKDEANR